MSQPGAARHMPHLGYLTNWHYYMECPTQLVKYTEHVTAEGWSRGFSREARSSWKMWPWRDRERKKTHLKYMFGGVRRGLDFSSRSVHVCNHTFICVCVVMPVMCQASLDPAQWGFGFKAECSVFPGSKRQHAGWLAGSLSRPQLTAKLHLGFKKRKHFLPLLLVCLCVCLSWLA